jgi:hypothetical protein
MSDMEAVLHEVAFKAHQTQSEALAGDTVDIDEADLRKWLAPHLRGD